MHMQSKLSLLVAAILVLTITWADEVPWSSKVQVGGGGTGVVGTGDFNDDGLNDVAIARAGSFVWYPAPDFLPDPEYTMGDGSGNSYGGVAIDINSDGWTDFIASDGAVGSPPGRLWLFLHPGSPAAAIDEWQRIEIWNQAVWHQNDLKVADMDNDGRLDVVVRTRADNLRVLVALQNEDIQNWTTRAWPTGETANAPEGLGLGDVDNDGENEIILSGVYWDNPDGWRDGDPAEYLIDSNFVGKAVKSVVADLDNDGQSDDVVMSKAEGSQQIYLAWYKHNGNPQDGESAWSRQILRNNVSAMHALEVADFDQDGFLDIFAGNSFSQSGLFIFYGGADENVWTEQTIDTLGKQYVVSIADLDGDNDLDFVGPATWQGSVFAYFNQLDPGDPTEPPVAPSALVAAALSDTIIKLEWQDNANNESGFILERRENGQVDFEIVAQKGPNTNMHTDADLIASTAYDYRVKALNTAGESVYSNIASATTNQPPPPDVEAPTVPIGLVATSVQFNQVFLEWMPATDNVGVNEYQVYQSGIQVGRSSNTSFILESLTPETTYSFSVSASDDAGNQSAPSIAIVITTPAQPDLSDAIIAYYRLDQSIGGIAADETGNYPGALSGTPQWQSGAGQFGGALQFGGASDLVSLGQIDVAGNAGLTLAMWVNPSSFDGLASEARFISKAAGANDQQHYWMVGNYLDGTALRFRLKTNATTLSLVSPTGVLSQNSWQHVAATYDGTQMRLYLDGIVVASASKTGAIDSAPNVNVALANQPVPAGANRGLIGLLDDVVIFEQALDETQIASIMSGIVPASGLANAPSNLVANNITDVSVDLSWNDNSDNESEFVLERAESGAEFIELESLPANTTDYTDVNLNATTAYSYRVKAVNDLGESLPTNTIDVFTVACEAVGGSDCDLDGVVNAQDNCTLLSNPDQVDSDGDSFGNACDPDLNNDCVVNFIDVSEFQVVFLSNDGSADFNNDGVVNFLDFTTMVTYFLAQPGPSGLANSCAVR